MKTRVAVVLFAFAASSMVLAQGGVGSGSGGRGGTFSARITMEPGGLGAAITGAPYAGDRTSEHVQTLADGTHITQAARVVHEYRDSAGRTRTERHMSAGPMAAARDLPLIVEIHDPVTGVAYILDAPNRIAHRYVLQSTMPSRPLAPPASVATSVATAVNRTTSTAMMYQSATGTALTSGGALRPQSPQVASESLGTQVIEGVVAEGSRRTFTYPTGAMGNDRPISSTTETWVSPELKLVLLTKNSDPRSGDSTMRLVNISRAEPDASLFQPPPDYRIVDETGPVTITFTQP